MFSNLGLKRAIVLMDPNFKTADHMTLITHSCFFTYLERKVHFEAYSTCLKDSTYLKDLTHSKDSDSIRRLRVM